MSQISKIKYSDIQEAKRFDAEYFKPEYLRELNILKNYQTKNIGDFAFITDGQHGYHEVDNNSEISHLTARHMKNWFAINEDADRLAKWVDDKNKRSSLEEGDIIISTRGSVGYSALVTKEVLPANIDQDVARIKINSDSNIISTFLLVYLNSYFGQNWISKNTTGMVQQGLSLEKVRQIKIPILPQSFQIQIEKIVKEAYEKQNQSKLLYKEAEEILLKELGLLNYEIKHTLAFGTTKKEIDEAGRYDSEYFQPKYKEIIKRVESYSGGFDTVENIVNFKDRNFFPKENEKYKYLALSNISSRGYVQDFQEEIGKNLPSRARRKINTGDVVISSIEGSLSSCALIEVEFNNFICSTGFFVINSEKINSETLLILFKSKIIQELLGRGSKGTILTAISKSELEKIKIPLIDSKIQKQIAEKIQESHRLRKESKGLLEEAKRKVEEEIEKR